MPAVSTFGRDFRAVTDKRDYHFKSAVIAEFPGGDLIDLVVCLLRTSVMAPVSLDGPDVPTTAKKTVQSDAKGMNFPSPPLFGSKYAERAYKLERLAAAFRIFGKVR